jgi:hypothetical protein
MHRGSRSRPQAAGIGETFSHDTWGDGASTHTASRQTQLLEAGGSGVQLLLLCPDHSAVYLTINNQQEALAPATTCIPVGMYCIVNYIANRTAP